MVIRPFLVAAAALAALAGCNGEAWHSAAQAADSAQASTAAELVPVTIRSAKGTHVFEVEIARTEQEQARGLMYRASLPANGGMLFPFDPARPASFWMKNTPLPLDMLFIRPDGSIARIAAETVPYSLDPVASGEPVAAVLEIAGGAAAAAGIEEGDRASWPGGPAS
jgi:uncharacterized membrane protein (UPF0127 family)